MRSPRLVLLGTFAATLTIAAVGATWLFLHESPAAEPPGEALPLPPEPPRLTEDPEYDRCLGMLRTDPQGAQVLADAWEATGGGEGARHCAALALLGLGEPDRAAERLEFLAARSQAGPAARSALYAQAGQAWMMASQPDRAFAATTLGLSLTPRDVDLLVDRSVALGTLGRYREALEDLDSAVAIDPDRAEAWVFRAAALRHLDRTAEAEEAVAKALALDPDNAEGLLERGIIRQLKGDIAGARSDWERAITLAPDSPTADLAQQNLALSEAGPQRR